MNAAAAELHDSRISIAQIIGVVWARKWLVVAAVVTLTTIAVVAAHVMTPIYRAKILAAPADTTDPTSMIGSMLGQFGGLAAMAGLNLSGTDSTVEALALLQSRHFIQDFIDDKKLLPVLYEELWDPEKQAWKPTVKNPPTLWKAYGHFTNKILNAYRDRKTTFVVVEIDWTDPVQAAEWANELVARVNEIMRARAIDEATRTIEHLNKELQGAGGVELRSAIYRMIDAQVKMETVASVRPQFALKIIDPAIAPDADSVLRPKKPLYYLGGPLLGFLLGVSVALVLDSRSQSRLEAG